MFNIFDFIDSKDIREYNKDHQFTPAEKAVLITLSTKTTVHDKSSALLELLNTYDDSSFDSGSVKYNMEGGTKYTVRQYVKQVLDIYGRAMNKNYNNAIYKVYIDYIDQYTSEIRERGCCYFASFEAADEYIHQDPGSMKIKGESYCVERYLLGYDLKYEPQDLFIYNYDKKLIAVCDEDGNPLEDYFVYLDVPFKKGDIVKEVYIDGSVEYGILTLDYPDLDGINKLGDNSCYIFMHTPVLKYNKSGGYYAGVLDTVACEYATEEELKNAGVSPLLSIKYYLDGKIYLNDILNTVNRFTDINKVLENHADAECRKYVTYFKDRIEFEDKDNSLDDLNHCNCSIY